MGSELLFVLDHHLLELVLQVQLSFRRVCRLVILDWRIRFSLLLELDYLRRLRFNLLLKFLYLLFGALLDEADALLKFTHAFFMLLLAAFYRCLGFIQLELQLFSHEVPLLLSLIV